MIFETKKIYKYIIILALAGILLALAFSYLYTPKCASSGCFQSALAKCGKASYTDIQANATWQYNINGFSGETCAIYVKAVSLKTDVKTGTALQGKDMTCYIPKNVLGAFMPEEKIEYCHGLLKEEIQNLIIENMHLYIIQNIGAISEAAEQPAIS